MSIKTVAEELQLDVDNALAVLEELRGFLYHEWQAQKMDTPKELHIHGLRVDTQNAINRLNKHATVEV